MKRLIFTLMAGSLLAAAGCSQPQQPQQPDAQAQPAEPEFRLPVSLNDVMVALVNEAADPIWVAAWREPDSEAQWRELERRAYQLQLAGALIAHPGTGALDDQWTSDEKWLMWSNKLRAAGEFAITAVEQRDNEAISAAGDDIVEVCEGCHIDFKLPMPTAGKFGELSPTADDFPE